MHCKRTGKIEYDLTKTKKKFTYKALVVALKTFSRIQNSVGTLFLSV